MLCKVHVKFLSVRIQFWIVTKCFFILSLYFFILRFRNILIDYFLCSYCFCIGLFQSFSQTFSVNKILARYRILLYKIFRIYRSWLSWPGSLWCKHTIHFISSSYFKCFISIVLCKSTIRLEQFIKLFFCSVLCIICERCYWSNWCHRSYWSSWYYRLYWCRRHWGTITWLVIIHNLFTSF